MEDSCRTEQTNDLPGRKVLACSYVRGGVGDNGKLQAGVPSFLCSDKEEDEPFVRLQNIIVGTEGIEGSCSVGVKKFGEASPVLKVWRPQSC